MALRPAQKPFEDVPERLTDGSRLVGMVSGGTPVYHDEDAAVFRDVDGTTGANRDVNETDRDGATEGDREPSGGDPDTTVRQCCRHAFDPDESVADAIAAVERHSGWAVLSEYGLEHLSDV